MEKKPCLVVNIQKTMKIQYVQLENQIPVAMFNVSHDQRESSEIPLMDGVCFGCVWDIRLRSNNSLLMAISPTAKTHSIGFYTTMILGQTPQY